MEGGLTYYDLYSDRCSWQDILHNLPWKDFKTREDGKMVKVRLQGTTCEIKRMKRCIERNKRIKVISVSDAFPNKGTKKYFRQYMDVMIDPNSEKKAVNQ